MIEKPLKIALVSVTDKTGIVEFAAGLVRLGYTIISTGGSAAALRENGIPLMEVGEYTQSPEILTGRVKTLHPKIHGGILYDRANPQHVAEAAAMGIQPIDLVVVNLYQFEKNAMNRQLHLAKAIEFIDVGGPTMLRAAAKNYRFCLPVIDPTDYPLLLNELKEGDLPLQRRVELARKVFAATAKYDGLIASYFNQQGESSAADASRTEDELPREMTLQLREISPLRYGENPHQSAKFYRIASDRPAAGLAEARVLQGKELSYNNILDLDGATALVTDFAASSCVAIIKHTNPCGIAISTDDALAAVYKKALSGDPKSAFGGIIATNETIDEAAALAMSATFYECIAAPGFTDEALRIFAQKKNLRLLVVPMLERAKAHNAEPYTVRSVCGGLLMQSTDRVVPVAADFNCVTQKEPQTGLLADLAFAMTVAKHVKSNAIVYARDLRIISVGAGQMSRIDSAAFAAQKAHDDGKSLTGAVMASDAFFPFRDSVDLAARWGISAIIQPGGSMRDQESIDACNEHGIAMVFTGKRHFKH